MKAYELLFFVAPTIDEESRAGVMKRIETTITEAKGQVDNVDEWGKRKLAMRSMAWQMQTTLSSTSMPIRRALRNSIVFFASTMQLCVT